MRLRADHYPEHWHKRRVYVDDFTVSYYETEQKTHWKVQKRKKIRVYFGSQWMSLNPSFVEYVGKSLLDDDSLVASLKKEYISRGFPIADETFFPTLLMNIMEFRSTIPQTEKGEGLPGAEWLKSMRFERMDEHQVSAFGEVPDTQRYVTPKHFYGQQQMSKPWGPYFLGAYDTASIKRSGALFIRKVSQLVEPNIYKIFPQESKDMLDALPDIDWNAQVEYEIAPRPNFDRSQPMRNRARKRGDKEL